jgi:small-conductance mechanosensitive channel
MECLDSARWSVQREFNRRILDQFSARGIQIANPRRTVMVTNEAPASPDTGAASSAPDTSRAAVANPSSTRP